MKDSQLLSVREGGESRVFLYYYDFGGESYGYRVGYQIDFFLFPSG